MRSNRNTKGIASFFLATLLLFFATPVLAICCKCHTKTAPSDNLCLTDTAATDCASLLAKNAANKALDTITCDPAPAAPDAFDETAKCKPLTNGGSAMCTVGPVSAVSYTAPATTNGAATVPTITSVASVPLELGVPIPGLTFSKNFIATNGNIEIPFLAQYLAAIYNYLLGIVVITAAVMIVYGGFKYVLSSTVAGVQSGKDVIFGSYTILQAINPQDLNLQGVKIQAIKQEEEPKLSDFNAMRILFGHTAINSAQDAANASGQPSSGSISPGPNSSEITQSSKGCGNSPAITIDFPYSPPGYVDKPTNASGWVPAASKIIVPGAVLNCPGQYPVLLWMHGNTDVPAKVGLDKAIKDASTTHVSEFQSILNQKVTSGQSQPLIIVYPVSYGANASLFPGMTLTGLRDAALAALKQDPRTAGVTFSSVSVGAHSGAGCNPPWGKVQSVNPYAILNADTCFGATNEAGQNPQKLVMIVANMHTLNNIYTYQLAVQAHKMEDLSPCPQVPFPIDNTAFSIPKTGDKTFPRMNCMKTPGKDWYMFFAADHNHSTAPAKALTYALDHFFPAQK